MSQIHQRTLDTVVVTMSGSGARVDCVRLERTRRNGRIRIAEVTFPVISKLSIAHAITLHQAVSVSLPPTGPPETASILTCT